MVKVSRPEAAKATPKGTPALVTMAVRYAPMPTKAAWASVSWPA